MTNGSKVLIYLSFLLLLKDLLLYGMQKEKYESQINQNFATVCHTEVFLTFPRLAAILSEMMTNLRS